MRTDNLAGEGRGGKGGAARTALRRVRVHPGARILRTVQFNLVIYLTLGLPIAALPTEVNERLGFGTVLAGLAVSLQYVGTLLSRPSAGRIVDVEGPRRAVLLGLAAAALSGALLVLAAALARWPAIGLLLLAASRLLAGCAESWGSTGAIMWTIGRLGSSRTAPIISWNGITAYGGLAVGAPIGIAVSTLFGFAALGVLVAALATSALLVLRRYPDVPVRPGKRLGFASVFLQVTPYGLALLLGTVGFGTVASFGALLFRHRGWNDPALALTGFGAALVLSRLLLAGRVGRWGALPVSLVSLAVETAGLAAMSAASSPSVAVLGAAISGGGFALVFPSLGVVAVNRVDRANRGSALGAFSLFSDLALGLSGPAAGLVAEHLGFGAVFGFAAVSSLAAVLLVLLLRGLTGGEGRSGEKPHDTGPEAGQ